MDSKASKLFSRMELLYENLLNLLLAQSTADSEDRKVTLRAEDGSTREITIKSYETVQKELNRISNNFQQLTSDKSYWLNKDGSVKVYKQTSAMNAEYINVNNIPSEAVSFSNTDLIEDFIFPIVKLPIELDKNLKITDSVNCIVYDVTYGFENVKDNITLVELEHMLSTGKITGSKYNRKLDIKKKQVELYGSFNIESILATNDMGTSRKDVILNTVYYSNKFSLTPNLQLKVGDVLVSNDGSVEYTVAGLIPEQRKVTLENITSLTDTNLQVGINQLYFNQRIASETNTVVYLPIKPNKNLVVFFQSETAEYVSYPSSGFKVQTNTMTVVHDSKTYTIDEYFNTFVTNFSEYLSSLMQETSIPFSLGIKPNKPVLEAANFQVVQINKHLVDGKTRTEIGELNKEKQKLKNEIEHKESQIKQYQTEIDSLKYNSIEEKNYRIQSIKNLREEINVLQQNVLVISRNIDNNATETGLKHITPKYRVIGYWSIQEPIFSPNTLPQNIIKYEVLYRYLSKGSDVSETNTYKMVDGGKEVSVVFSNWNEYKSMTLNKKMVDGKLVWETQRLDSVEDININQCSISINESESVEIKVRAVSEAGYPVSPLKSEWSDIIRIDFPDSLKDSNLHATVTKNNQDLNLAEFHNVLNSTGLLSHIVGTIKDGDRTFHHQAKDISSGQYTPEQKHIPLDIFLRTLLDRVLRLENNNEQNSVSISFVDFDNEIYSIQSNSTLEIFAGNYTDSINIVNPEQYGSIISKKAYIKIHNSSSTPAQVQSLIKTVDNFNTLSSKYTGIPLIIGDSIKQKEKQIIYFRNKELFSNNLLGDLLVKLDENDLKPTFPLTNVKQNSSESEQNLIGLRDGQLVPFALNDINKDIDAIVIHKSVLDNTTDEFKNQLVNEFKRLQTVGQHLQKDKVQLMFDETVINRLEYTPNKIGFNHIVDPFTIGKQTLGAWLYPQILKESNIQTIGDGYNSSYIIPANSEILIPIIFEYRMTDKLGKTYSSDKHDISFVKKLGVDMFINNKEFSFDIQVTAKLKSKISSLSATSITTISGAYKSEKKETIE